MPSKDLPVVDRGSFFDDSFFRDSWDDFDKAMQRVLDRFDGSGRKIDSQSRPQCQDMYRKIRSNRINEDMYASQAIEVTEKDGRFQVVIDVSDFNPRDLQVKVVDEKIVLEGRYDKVSEDGKSSTSKAFYREFALPLEADIDQVSTALSRDGILTVRAPRKVGSIAPEEPSKKKASQFLQGKLSEHRFGNESGPFRNRPYVQSPSRYDTDGFECLPRDLNERLMFSDRDSGRSTASGSPILSGGCNISSCASPAPSDAVSETSRVSANMDFDTGRKAPFQKADVSFKMRSPVETEHRQGYPSSEGMSPTLGGYYSSTPQTHMSKLQPKRSVTAPGSGGTATITVKEEDGKKTLTSETSSLVQEKDGFLETKELAAEISEKDSQAARREASTRMMKRDEDPEGRYKKSEAADASDVSETCVQTLPDGSVVTVKKSSTSSSNFKQSFSTGGPGLLDQRSSFGFGDFPGMMGKSQNLKSQMSSDSLSSNTTGVSSFSDMSNFSRFSDMSNFSSMSDFSNVSSGFHNRPFPDRPGVPSFSNIPSRTSFSNFPSTGPQMSPTQRQHNTNENYSTQSHSSSHSSYSSSSDNRKF